MEATSARTAQARAVELPPDCPICGSGMAVHAHWQGDLVTSLYWACRRAPVCYGTARIRRPDNVVPVEHDASSQALFEWEQTRDAREAEHPVVGGLRGLLGKVATRNAAVEVDVDDVLRPKFGLASLIDHGFVILSNRRMPSAHVTVDHVVIGPPGVFAIEVKEWPGFVSISDEDIFVDGRERVGVVDRVLRAASALEDTLEHELRPLGAPVRAAVLFDNATNRAFTGSVARVTLGGDRSLPKEIRAAGAETLGPETVVRLALAADRLLE